MSFLSSELVELCPSSERSLLLQHKFNHHTLCYRPHGTASAEKERNCNFADSARVKRALHRISAWQCFSGQRRLLLSSCRASGQCRSPLQIMHVYRSPSMLEVEMDLHHVLQHKPGCSLWNLQNADANAIKNTLS